MTDPNYEHEFWPNRKGTCQRVVSGGHCHLPEDAPVHVRWEERHPPKTNWNEVGPELLEALRGIVAADFDSVPRSAVYRAIKLLQDEARAAIAKAEGGA